MISIDIHFIFHSLKEHFNYYNICRKCIVHLHGIFREMNYWLGVGKCQHTYEATNMMKICSVDADISSQRNVPSRRHPGVISIDL